jgi:Ni,Fe-hydrogenase I cytochrome b subunit
MNQEGAMKGGYKFRSEQWKATFSFWGTVSLAVMMFGLMTTGFWAGKLAEGHPIRFWQTAIVCCHRILSRCHFSVGVLLIGLTWLSVGMLCIGFLYACRRFLQNIWKTRRFLRCLHKVDSPVQLLPNLPSNVPLKFIRVFRHDSMK